MDLVKEAIAKVAVIDIGTIKPIKREGREVITDLHIHSKYSRATSKNLDIPSLVKYARIKGVDLLGTGDISHEKWIGEIKQHLKEKGDDGIYWFEDSSGRFPFMLSGEISLVFTSNGKGRRVHLVYLVPNLEVNSRINAYLDSKGRRDYDGRPIFNISCENFVRDLLAIDSRIEIIPAHIWTPWFGVFGSASGFDSLKEAFGEQEKNIHAIETGMSSDPEMNLKIAELNNKSIISFSDLHSFWPWRMGREATIFKIAGEIAYDKIIEQIRDASYSSTIETDPCYGKYHYDGHRLCNFSCSPQKTKELEGICPVCKKPLIIGVENRVQKLTNFLGMSPNKKAFYKILPLHELIAFYLDSSVSSKKSWAIYNKLIEKFGNEFNILLRVDKNVLQTELEKEKHEGLAKLILDNRIANLRVKPGYDGEYGVLVSKEDQTKLI